MLAALIFVIYFLLPGKRITENRDDQYKRSVELEAVEAEAIEDENLGEPAEEEKRDTVERFPYVLGGINLNEEISLLEKNVLKNASLVSGGYGELYGRV